MAFDGPAPLTLPNTDGLAPGQVTELYSFDHDLGAFVSIGTGTVSNDGTMIGSDPGVGVVKAGWHCGGPPSTTGSGESLEVTSVDGPSMAELTIESSPYTAEANAPGIRWRVEKVGGGAADVLGIPTGPSSGETSTITLTFKDAGVFNVIATCGTVDKIVETTVEAELELVTPAGDPKTSPSDSGDGQNEFVFNEATPGVLEINFKAKLLKPADNPDALNAIKDKVVFTVDDIGDSTKTWDASNPDGKASVSGDFLVAKVTFTNLPANNTDFGKKNVALMFDGKTEKEGKIEVFYKAIAKNHPDGNSDYPNWFHYYQQNEGGADYSYENVKTSSAESGKVVIGNDVFNGNIYLVTAIIGEELKLIDPLVSKENKYYAAFIGIVAHERMHLSDGKTKNSVEDRDQDNLSNEFETGTSKTNPDGDNSASFETDLGSYADDEVYFGGPVEKAATMGADTSQDWAHPGTNSKQ